MSGLKRPFNFGKITLPSNIFYAPLAGWSDFPYRSMSARYRPGLIFCEMVKMDALIRGDQNTLHYLDYGRGMHPIGAQLCGSKPEIAGHAAKIIEGMGFDVLDLNCGCPVDKVVKDGSGSGMLKDPQRIGDVLANLVAAVNIPVTVKIRLGWDSQNIIAEEITQIAEAAGAVAITIHGRTRAQGYTGNADWVPIRRCKEAAKNIKVIANGDIFTAEDAKRAFDETGCDGVLVARGTMGNPWIADDVYRLYEGLPPVNRTVEDSRKELLEHFTAIKSHFPERRVLIDMRRVGCAYFTGHPNARGTRVMRTAISQATSLEEMENLIHTFSFD